MNVGEYKLRNVRHGTFYQDAVMARRVPYAQLKKDPAIDSEGREVLGANSLLIQKGGQNILVFASMGSIRITDQQMRFHGLTPTTDAQGRSIPAAHKIVELPQALAHLSITTNDITHVVLTHLEYDHSAGLADAEGNPYCPNATHLVRKGEVDYARSKTWPDFYNTSVLGDLETNLGAKWVQIDGVKDYNLDGIVLQHTGGHTPHHQIVHGGGFWHLGDLMHDEHVLPPAKFNVYSRDMDAVLQLKKDFLSQIIANGDLVFFNHGHQHHAGRIQREGKKYILIPVDLNSDLAA